MTVRIRKAEFNGAEDKFYAPADDIRNCFVPIVRGALDMATEAHPDKEETLVEVARLLAKFYMDTFLEDVDIVEMVSTTLGDLDEDVRGIVCEAVTRSMMVYHATAQRECASDPDLTKMRARSLCEVGSALSKVDRDTRESVRAALKKASVYPKELDRGKPEGVIKDVDA